MGVLGWTPEQFWQATPHDLLAALDGWREAHGLRGSAPPLGVADVTRLRALLRPTLRPTSPTVNLE
jgi:hypothetical protein